jgi:hypothetical protein
MLNPICNATIAFSLAAAMGICSDAGAAVLMLDFGGTTVAGTDRTNSPYHAVNGSFTDTSWNSQGQGNDPSHVWSDGTTATGVSLTTLKGNAGSTALTSAGWSSSVNATAVNTGIYAGTSVARDGHMMTSNFSEHRPIGIQLSGLAPGEYDVYITGRNTNYTAAEYTVNHYVAAGATAGSFDFGAYATGSNTFAASATDKVDSWQFTPGNASASNYVKLTVTLTQANPYLNIGTIGSGTNGVFNSVQVVAVPEPASLGLLVLAGLAARRRRV